MAAQSPLPWGRRDGIGRRGSRSRLPVTLGATPAATLRTLLDGLLQRLGKDFIAPARYIPCMAVETELVPIENPDGLNVILGQTHFIKTAEDVHEALVNAVPGIRFGVAFCEASGPCLVRVEGNDEALKALAAKNALAVGAGHFFVVFVKEAYPLNLLRAIREVPEVVNLYAATANPIDVVVATNVRGRGVLGVIDGERSRGIEGAADRKERIEFLRKIGYKLG